MKMKLLMENWRKFTKLNELTMDRLLDSKYELFVKYLGANMDEPKVLAMIDAGQEDGSEGDDKFAFSEGAIPVIDLRPMQMEVDIDKSLKFINSPFLILSRVFLELILSKIFISVKFPSKLLFEFELKTKQK